MKDSKKALKLMPIIAVLTIVVYIILHEAGHCIVAAACGARITQFSIITAHMAYEGGSFTGSQMLWFHANGAFLPVTAAYINMLIYPKECRNALYRIVTYVFSVMTMFSLIAWIIIPILYTFGKAPATDDCTKFLDAFTIDRSPYWVTGCAALMITLGEALMLAKHVFTNFKELMRTTVKDGKSQS